MPDSPLAVWLQAQDPGREPGGPGAAVEPPAPGQDDEDGTKDARDPLGPLDLGATPGTRQDLWDLGAPPPPSGRMRRLLVVAALPLLAVLLVAGALAAGGTRDGGTESGDGRPGGGDAAGLEGATGDAEEPAGRPAGSGEEPAVAASDSALPAAPDSSAPDGAMSAVPEATDETPLAPAAPDAGATQAMRAMAELHVRAALSGPLVSGGQTEPAGGTQGSADQGAGDGPAVQARARYADTAVATAVTRVGDVAVVAVSALLLEGGPDGWDTARPVRYAVALRSSATGPQPLGAPWALDVPEVAPVPASPVDPDPALAARVAAVLESAGYSGLEDLAVARPEAPRGVLLARVRARAPGASHPADHVVWLTDDPSPSVLGR